MNDLTHFSTYFKAGVTQKCSKYLVQYSKCRMSTWLLKITACRSYLKAYSWSFSRFVNYLTTDAWLQWRSNFKWTEYNSHSFVFFKVNVLFHFSSFLLQPPLFCFECRSFSHSAEPHGQSGVLLCQVESRKHSSCCLVWAPCVGAGRPLAFTDPIFCGQKAQKICTGRHELNTYTTVLVLSHTNKKPSRLQRSILHKKQKRE